MKIGDKEFPYSFSQNRLYNDCPRKYKYRYFDGIKEPTNENLELGSAIHKVFEVYNNSTSDELRMNEEYIAAADTIIALKGQYYFNQLMTEFIFLTEANNQYNLGREFEITIDDFVIIIDLVHNYTAHSHKYTLCDYKVTKKPKTIQSIYDEGQLLIYKYLWCLQHPEIDPNDVAVQYVNILPYLSSNIISVTEPQVPSIETCKQVYEAALHNKQKILNNEFPKRKNWCRWCYYRDKCQQDKT